jgi:hypothetical protein
MSDVQQRLGDEKSAFSTHPLTHDDSGMPDTSLCKSNVGRSRPEYPHDATMRSLPSDDVDHLRFARSAGLVAEQKHVS